ncbi:TonB-dependent receptor [Hymenobacter sp. BRD128]|uniref:SusC/RagA family TonB-linked outer membrane protein n=1 Tax=Hymenobacter sp. BRD128 TaxID=2675878 RepID=UPI0015666D5D|nr:TonB-dependent receptor [Hymenobacter sp. BRD128]QKG56501.1 TonB-dependent receptor [Hymenobacter sp. BRD128]
MRKSVPKMRRLVLPAALSCLPLQPLLAHALAAIELRENIPAAGPITGLIVDEKGAGLPGVNVLVKGTNVGTATNADGRYTIEAPAGATLVFSYIGYASQEVAVGDRSTVDVALTPDSRALNDVVVVGYLAQDRQNLSSAVGTPNLKEATKQPVPTITQALQGQVAGLQITGSGGPGDAPVVIIRGAGSAGNSNSAPLYVIDGLWTDNIRDLNPNDIATLTVLKDASSTAIYGARGANGVIQITTKKGKAGVPTIGVNAYIGVDNVYKRYQLTNASQWADRAVQAYANAGIDPLNAGQNSLAGAVKGPGGAFNPNVDTNWQDAFFRTGKVENYNVSFSGGTTGENIGSNYLISGEYFHQEGVVKGPDFKRYSLRLNSGMTKGRFRFQENAQLTHLNTTLLNGAPFIDVLTILPSVPVYDPNNQGGFGVGSTTQNTFATNPVGAQQLLRRTQSDNRLAGNMTMDYSIFDFLTYRLNLAMDGHTYSNADAQQLGILRQNTQINTSSLSEYQGYDVFLMAENTLNFNKTFGDHHVNVLGGYSERYMDFHNTTAQTQGFTASPQYYFQLSAGQTVGVVQGTEGVITNRSYFSQATYDYKNRYLVSGSFRRDGSSRFIEQNRFGNFGAASLGYRISEEDFFKNALPAVSNLKLRASYGIIGNDQLTGDYYGAYLPTPNINQNTNYVLGSGQVITNGRTQTVLSSNNLQWEERRTKDVGLDLAVLSNHLTFTADYYISETRKALAPVVVPIYTGNFGAVFQNAGNIENRGLELALGYQNATASGFTYSLNANLTTLRNQVLALPNPGQTLVDGQGLTSTSVGTSLGQFFLIPMAGIFQTQDEINNYKSADGRLIEPYAKPGDVKYTDTNGDGKIDLNDRVHVGSAFPTLQYGFNLSFGYKGFDLSVLAQGVSGNRIFNNAKVALESYNGPTNYELNVLPWTAANPSNSVPRALQGGSADPNLALAASQNALYQTTRWLEDGSYLRLKNVQLGYTFGKSALGWAPAIGSLRVYVTGRNLVTFTKYTGFDPEITGTGYFGRGIDNSAYPNVRTFTGGVQATF